MTKKPSGPRAIAATVLICAALLSGGCGKKTTLRPAAGKALPPQAQQAATQPSVQQLLMPDPQARPARDDELVTKSAPLAPDRFDLPPPG